MRILMVLLLSLTAFHVYAEDDEPCDNERHQFRNSSNHMFWYQVYRDNEILYADISGIKVQGLPKYYLEAMECGGVFIYPEASNSRAIVTFGPDQTTFIVLNFKSSNVEHIEVEAIIRNPVFAWLKPTVFEIRAASNTGYRFYTYEYSNSAWTKRH